MKKNIFIPVLLLLLTIGYLTNIYRQINIDLENGKGAYIGKFKSFDKKQCGDYVLHDFPFQILLQKSCKVSSELQFNEYSEKLLKYIEARSYNPLYFYTDAFFPINATPIMHLQQNYGKKILEALSNDFEKSILIQNFIPTNCELGNLDDAWSFLNKNTNPYLSHGILSAIKECYFMGKIKKEDFLEKGVKLLELHLNENVFLETFTANISHKKGIPKKIIRLFLFKNNILFKIKQNETLMYLDELSQFYYLQEDYTSARKTLEKYFKIFTNEFSLGFIDIQKNIALARLGKIYLRLGMDKEAEVILGQLAKSQEFFKTQSKLYYPDLSLAQLLLEKKLVNSVKEYLIALNKNGMLENNLYSKWINEINENKTPEFEVEIFKSRYDDKIDTHFKAEKSQILLFKESIK